MTKSIVTTFGDEMDYRTTITDEELAKLAAVRPSIINDDNDYDHNDVNRKYRTVYNSKTQQWVDIRLDTGEIFRFGDGDMVRCFNEKIYDHRAEIQWLLELVKSL